MRHALRIIAITALITGFSLNAHATDTDKGAGADAGEKVEYVKANNPYLDKVVVKAKAIAKDVNKEQAEDIGKIRESFGMLRSVGMVKRNIGNAVELCGKENPKLKKNMNKRFSEWSKKVEPAMEKQEKNLEKSLSKEHFSNLKDIEEYLDLLESAAKFADDQLDKEVVTTEKACKSLLESMDESEKTVTGLINELVWPDFVTGGAE